MYNFIFFIQTFLALVFLSTAYSKVRYFRKHIATIEAYGMLPNRFIPFFAVIEILLQVIISLSFFTGYKVSYTVWIGILLMIIYIVGIVYNLLVGKKDLDCGCGGIVGNHKISWKLVIRNSLIIFALVFISSNSISANSILQKENIPLFLSGFAICIMGFVVKKYKELL